MVRLHRTARRGTHVGCVTTALSALAPLAPDHEITAQAIALAGFARTYIQSLSESTLRLVGFGPTGSTWRTSAPVIQPSRIAAALDDFAISHQARPVAKKISLHGRIARMLDASWWRRHLRRQLLRTADDDAHARVDVRRARQVYLSEPAYARMIERARQNAAKLAALEVAADDESIPLADVVAGSVTNPRIRRAEVMMRCAGFEKMAEFMGHAAIFLTLTCPSRFHRFTGSGKPNPAWSGATPNDSQRYISALWARVRAALKRRAIKYYGFRVAEPHHDGCPHWHMLLFVDPAQRGWFSASDFVAGKAKHGAGLVGLIGAAALADTPGERGAVDHRFTAELIDPSKGSATGYIAKYISKNLDGLTEQGESVGLDFASGTDTRDGAPRVRAWASLRGVRQFQQLGGPSVTVWRELRRLRDAGPTDTEQLELFEKSRAAADRGDWTAYCMLMGGPETAPRDMPLRPAYVDRMSVAYGDSQPRVAGITGPHGYTCTRVKQWTIQRLGAGETNKAQTVWSGLVKRDPAFAAAWQRLSWGFGIWGEGEASPPWTRVDNCTADDGPQAPPAHHRHHDSGRFAAAGPPGPS